MGTLLGIAFVAGIVTALSPCVLPVLPIVFAAGATGSRRRPYAVVAGLVVSFTAFTLAATKLLDALGLPDDLLRWLAIGLVVLMGTALVVPRVGELLGRPFAPLARFRPTDTAGGFVLGLGLGLLFTPCAGPVIATVAAVGATRDVTADAVLVTLAYALGAGVVLLAIAVLAQRGVTSLAPLRRHAPVVRQALGGLMVVAGVVAALGLDTRLASQVPGYTRALQGLEESATASDGLIELLGGGDLRPSPADAAEDTGELADYGAAPEFADIETWLNTGPLTLSELRGKVVLIDFWTYSCVNCLRTLPHVRSWHEAYSRDGLVIVGVHTPEFAFERDEGNVAKAVRDLDVEYPVALDPTYGTWSAWGNRYWPAKYLIDKKGHVRFAHFGEGDYEETEQAIRALLDESDLASPVSSGIPDLTPNEAQTPESYVGYSRLGPHQGGRIVPDEEAEYALPDDLDPQTIAFGGRWTVEPERAIAGAGAVLGLRYAGSAAHLVLGPPPGGRGTVEVRLDGGPPRTIEVDGYRLYTLAETTADAADGFHRLELRPSPGVAAYAFTFGSLDAAGRAVEEAVPATTAGEGPGSPEPPPPVYGTDG